MPLPGVDWSVRLSSSAAVGGRWALCNTPQQDEIEISVFERGRLSRPAPDTATLQQRVQTLETERNERHATINWQFTTRDARVKLKKLYSVVKTPISASY